MEETHELVTVNQLCNRVYTIRGQQVMLDYDLAAIYGYEVKRLNEKTDKRGTNIKKLPYAFTEQGVYMLATVLRGKLAEQQSIFIMRAFREMRHYIKQNQQFVTQSEVDYLSAKVSEMSARVEGFGDWKNKTDQGSRSCFVYRKWTWEKGFFDRGSNK